MIEYLLKIKIPAFQSEKQQKKVQDELVNSIAEFNYVHEISLYEFKQARRHDNPRYVIPERKTLPKVYSEDQVIAE